MSEKTDLSVELQALQEAYVEELPQRLEAIAACWNHLCEQGWEQKALKQMNLLVHKLAGSGSTFGFPDLSEKSRHIEQGLKAWLASGTVPGEAERRQIQVLLSQLDGLVEPTPPDRDIPPIRSGPTEVPDEHPLVYLLEDDPVLAKKLALQLSQFGYEVLTFVDTEELERKIESRRPNALVMDIILAEGDSAGIQAAERIQKHHGEGLPILFQSSRDDFAARLGAVRAGASAYLVKPIDTDLVLEHLERLTGGREEEPYKIMLVDDDEPLAERYALVLRRAGMDVTVLNRANEVSDALVNQRPELILMDLYMPECSGWNWPRSFASTTSFYVYPSYTCLRRPTSISNYMPCTRAGMIS